MTRHDSISFRYPGFGNVARYGLALVAGGALALVRGVPLDVVLLVVGGAALGFYALYRLLAWIVPSLPDRKRLVVDADGLQVGRYHLPAERIAPDVVVVDADTASRAANTLGAATWIRCEIDGRRVASLRMVYPFWHRYPAVMVRDLGGGERPWWLLAAPDGVDADELAAALRSVAAPE